jgi:hypothetical protein
MGMSYFTMNESVFNIFNDGKWIEEGWNLILRKPTRLQCFQKTGYLILLYMLKIEREQEMNSWKWALSYHLNIQKNFFLDISTIFFVLHFLLVYSQFPSFHFPLKYRYFKMAFVSYLIRIWYINTPIHHLYGLYVSRLFIFLVYALISTKLMLLQYFYLDFWKTMLRMVDSVNKILKFVNRIRFLVDNTYYICILTDPILYFSQWITYGCIEYVQYPILVSC